MAILLRTALILAAARGVAAEACPGTPDDTWTELVLDASINYKAYHKVLGSDLHLRLSATHTGWVGFGFPESSSGHMKGSDLMTASVSGGTVTVDDRYATFAANEYPNGGANNVKVQGFDGLWATADTHNDWTIVSGESSGGVLSVYATRPLNTSDLQDRVIATGVGSPYLWSWGSGTTVSYHGSNRGVGTTVYGGSGTGTTPLPAADGIQSFSFSPYTIPARHTLYSCEAFEVGGTSSPLTDPVSGDPLTEVHAVAFEPTFSETTRKHVHHIVLHVCEDNQYWQNHKLQPMPCGALESGQGDFATVTDAQAATTFEGVSPVGQSASGCNSVMWAWAVGSGNLVLPDEAGFRVGGPEAKYLLMEVHYDNPDLETGRVDTVGFNMHWVKTFRTYDAGMVNIGDPSVQLRGMATGTEPGLPDTNFHVGPLPVATSSTDLHVQATCPTECTSTIGDTLTDSGAGNSDMKVFGLFHHAHYYGKRVILEHRDAQGNFKTQMDEKLHVNFWDNSFQKQQSFSAGEFTIAEGDQLQSHCTYDLSATSGQSGNVVDFGTSTNDEMCMHFVFYYPMKYRGGKPFSLCGVWDRNPGVGSICGNPLSSNPSPFLGDNTDSNQEYYALPPGDGFGTQTAGLAAATPGTATECSGVADSTVTFSLTAAGDVSDYSAAVTYNIEKAVAEEAGVSVAAVSVTVASGSVVITTSIAVAASDAATVSSALASSTASASAASTMINRYLASPITVAAVASTPTIGSVSSPSPPALPPVLPASSSDDNGMLIAIIAAAAGGVLLLAVAIGVYMMKSKGGAPAKKKGGAPQTSV